MVNGYEATKAMCHAIEPVQLSEHTALHKTQKGGSREWGMEMKNEWSTNEPPTVVDMETALTWVTTDARKKECRKKVARKRS